jgi:hypothetical protein
MLANVSFKVYPRPDEEFKKKQSLDFDMARGNCYKKRPVGDVVQLYLWINCFIIGITTGFLAFLLNIFSE